MYWKTHLPLLFLLTIFLLNCLCFHLFDLGLYRFVELTVLLYGWQSNMIVLTQLGVNNQSLLDAFLLNNFSMEKLSSCTNTENYKYKGSVLSA